MKKIVLLVAMVMAMAFATTAYATTWKTVKSAHGNEFASLYRSGVAGHTYQLKVVANAKTIVNIDQYCGGNDTHRQWVPLKGTHYRPVKNNDPNCLINVTIQNANFGDSYMWVGLQQSQ